MIYKQSQFRARKEHLEQYILELKRQINTFITENICTLNIRKLLPFSWLISIIAVAILTLSLQNESSHFFGIADNSEQTISFSYPVEIVQNLVIEGAEVKQGQPILEVRRPDLSAKLTIINDKIRAATATHDKTVNDTRAKLKELTAMRSAELAELDVQINTLRARQKINGKLLKDISGKKAAKSSSTPLDTEMRGLREQRRHLQDSFDARIANLKSQLESENDNFKVQIAESQDRKYELERQFADLTVRAKFDGRIGSINSKAGDQIAPFETILTVHSSTPLFVKGYIHENSYNQLSVGQQVWIQRYNSPDDNDFIQGKVESLGSRIVEYPMRLKRNQLVSAWGREAIVRLPQMSSLLLGEKVIVAMQSPDNTSTLFDPIIQLFHGAISDAEAASGDRENLHKQLTRPIVSKLPGVDASTLEASGILYTQKQQEFLVINDEASKRNPHLLVMNHRGEITKIRKISGNAEIDDMESISSDGNNIYVSASLSHNRKGKYKSARCQLLKLEPEKDQYRVSARLNLCDTLAQLAKTAEDRSTRQFLIQAFARKAIDVESHFISKGKLYLGFKAPFDDRGNSVILQIDNLQSVFAGNHPQGRIWLSVSLLDPENGAPALLSDMRLDGDQLLLLGICQSRGHPSSHLWSYDLKQSKLRVVDSFPELKAEGVSSKTRSGHLVLVFDGDRKSHSRLAAIQANK